jgi:hypothetical protein
LSALDNAEKLIPELPLKQQNTYQNLLTELRAYAALEVRDYANIMEQDFPELQPLDGLRQEEHALTMRRIYLEKIATQQDTIAQVENDLRDHLQTLPDNEGLRDLLQTYQAELLLLKYKFLNTHFIFNKFDREDTAKRDKAKADLLAMIDALPSAKKAGFERRISRLEESTQQQDNPPYDILERKFLDNIKRFDPQAVDFWQGKQDIDQLLDTAERLNGGPVSAGEVAAAVNTLYDLGLENLPDNPLKIAQYPDSELVKKVGEFRARFLGPRGSIPAFEFASAEKGYGYYLLLKLLSKEKNKDVSALLDRLKTERYLEEQNGCYTEAGLLIITYLNELSDTEAEQRAARRQKEPSSAPVSSWLAGQRIVLPKLEKPENSEVAVAGKVGSLLGEDFKEAIRLAEKHFGLDSPQGYADLSGVYAKLNKEDIKYSMARILLDLYGALIRARGQAWNTKGVDAKLDRLDTVLAQLFGPENVEKYGYIQESAYFNLKRNLLAAQLYTARVTPYAKDPYIPLLRSAEQELRNELTARQNNLPVDSAEYLVIEDILRGVKSGAVPDRSELPNDASYLYADIYSSFAFARLKLSENPSPQLILPWSARQNNDEAESQRLFTALRNFNPQSGSVKPLEIELQKRQNVSPLSFGQQLYFQIPRTEETTTQNTYEVQPYDRENDILLPAIPLPEHVQNGQPLNSQVAKTTTSVWGMDFPLLWSPFGDVLQFTLTPSLRQFHIETEQRARNWIIESPEDGSTPYYKEDELRTGIWQDAEDFTLFSVTGGLNSVFWKYAPLGSGLTILESRAGLTLGYEQTPWLALPMLSSLYKDFPGFERSGHHDNFSAALNWSFLVAPRGMENTMRLGMTPVNFLWNSRGGQLYQEKSYIALNTADPEKYDTGYYLERVSYRDQELTYRPDLSFGLTIPNTGLSFDLTGGPILNYRQTFDFAAKANSDVNQMRKDLYWGAAGGLSFSYVLPKVRLGAFGGAEHIFGLGSTAWYAGLEIAASDNSSALTVSVNGFNQPGTVQSSSNSAVNPVTRSKTDQSGQSTTSSTPKVEVAVGVRVNGKFFKNLWDKTLGKLFKKKG